MAAKGLNQAGLDANELKGGELSMGEPEMGLPELRVQTEEEKQEEKRVKTGLMREKYGDFICPCCKFFVRDKKACGWKYSVIMIKKILKALQEREINYGKTQYCELFQERVIDPEKEKKSRINWRERVLGKR